MIFFKILPESVSPPSSSCIFLDKKWDECGFVIGEDTIMLSNESLNERTILSIRKSEYPRIYKTILCLMKEESYLPYILRAGDRRMLKPLEYFLNRID